MVVTRTLQLLIRMPEVPSFVNAYTARSSQTQRSLLDADCNRCPRFPTPPHCGSVSVCKRGSGSTKLVACKEISLQIVNPPSLPPFGHVPRHYFLSFMVGGPGSCTVLGSSGIGACFT